MRIVRVLVGICTGLVLLLLLASYLGALHPAGDSLAVFRLFIAAGLGLLGAVLVLLRDRRIGFAAILAAAAASIQLAALGPGAAVPVPAETDLVVYSKNLWSGRTDWDGLSGDIAAAGADVVLLQEVTAREVGDLPALLPDHPYRHVCNFSGWSAMVVASRYPLSEPGCTDHRSLAHAVVAAPGGPVWVASIHQVWPYPHGQAALLPDILAAIEAAPTRRVIAGDFNMVPWGHSVRRIMGAAGARRISPVQATIEVRGIGLPIDHVLTDGSGAARLRPRFGSDHHGMVAWIIWEES